jgi:hypothetical protein
MKLSKTSWIFLAVGVCVIVFASLSMTYSRQGQERNQLNQELSSAQLKLARYSLEGLSSQQKELESHLTEAEAELEEAKARIQQSNESIEVTDSLFQVAESCDVEIIEISSGSLASKKLEELTCSILSFVVTVEGEVSDIIDFTIALSREFPTGAAQAVQIEIPEVIEEEEEEEEEETGGESEGEEAEEEEEEEEELVQPSADIQVIIYNYQGD